MHSFSYLAAGVLATLAVLHLVYTIHDAAFAPRYFVPRDRTLLERMRATTVVLAPGGRDYWTALIGFHLSHSIGVMLFALLIVLATAYPIAWLKPLLVAVGVVYTVIAWRCWFRIPLAGCAAATVLMAIGWSGGS